MLYGMNRYLDYFGMVIVWYGFCGGMYICFVGGVGGIGRFYLILEFDIVYVYFRMFLCFWGFYIRGKFKVVGFKCVMIEEKYEWVVSIG